MAARRVFAGEPRGRLSGQGPLIPEGEPVACRGAVKRPKVTDRPFARELAEGAKAASRRLFDQRTNTEALVAYYVDALRMIRSGELDHGRHVEQSMSQ